MSVYEQWSLSSEDARRNELKHGLQVLAQANLVRARSGLHRAKANTASSRKSWRDDRMKPEGLGMECVESIFYQANFIRDLNIRLDKVAEGICETSLVVQERLRQQHGFVHGGVIATMADHTAAARRVQSLAKKMC